ncbi:MAG: bifunctional diaminohydroxyphosphoribosylaminopyrimidine deaminase/5-amino-6-(5-phosphoribosylamino)uracil reductase RibD [Methyloligellaceae bacterium]
MPITIAALMNKSDNFYMRLALKLSRRGLGRCAPNPCVGAVIVQGGDVPVVVGRGWTQPSGRPHAETVALEQAGEKASGATLYVTLEPCSHYGKTPPCAEAVIKAGIKHVVYAALDPDHRVAGRGLAMLRESGITVRQVSSDLVEQAQWIMKGHILRQVEKRPFIQVKLGVDADLMVSNGNGAPVWVTCPTSRSYAHLLRAQADAILVGRGTAEADNPDLTCRLPGMKNRSPIRILLDRNMQVSASSNLYKSATDTPLWVICSPETGSVHSGVAEYSGAQLITVPVDSETGTLSIPELLTVLADKGITRLMVEGGPKVVRSFQEKGLIDELVLFQSKTRLGDAGSLAVEGTGLKTMLESDRCNLVFEQQVDVDHMQIYRFS